ncbi:MAG: hypothetical protein K9N09_03100 [Candidatus Cloacimonetes bacterium]|nr:hypothetical protein [Candidatus Cloacimonadota bacterium]MCF7883539.1 hypothetical protein [Candidatus Cloacimonadota bacterium]
MRFLILFIISFLIFSCSNNSTGPDPDPQIDNPYNLQIEQLSEDAIKLIWEIPENENNQFSISRKIGETSWDHEFALLEEGTTSFIDSIYTQAFVVYSYFLTEISDSLLFGTSDTVAFFSDNSLPTNINLEHIKQDSIKISWHDNSLGEFYYGIDKKIGNGNWIEEYLMYEPRFINGSNSDMFIVDHNDCLSDSVFYRIYLMNGISKSEKINCSILSSLLPPCGLWAAIENVGIKLNWTDNYITETGFLIERKQYNETYVEIFTTGANIHSYLDENLDPEAIYFYRIKVIVDELSSSFSEPVIGSVDHEGHWIPLDYPDIQSAIDASSNTFQIVVLPGIYHENLVIHNKYPVIKSLFSIFGDESFIDETIINGDQNGSAIAFKNCHSYISEISGLTLTNGSGNYEMISGAYYYGGGGIHCENSDIFISNVKIVNNYADIGAGLICSENSNCELSDCQISGNTVLSGNGGGVYCYDSELIINECVISDNSTHHWGGGLFIAHSTLNIHNSSFTDNFANYHGGGLYLSSQTDALLENVQILRNNAGSTGGGIRSSNSNPTFRNLLISKNTANDGGGIAFGSTQNPVFENVLITNNIANYGGGIHTSSVDVHITNVTVYNNTATIGGGGLYSRHYADPVLLNCIFWENSPQEIMIRPGNQPSNEGTVTISYSNIKDGLNSVSALYANDIFWLEGNINADPMFIDPLIDFHLQSISPSIDSGIPERKFNDPDGSRNDMGAYGGPFGNW